MPALVYRFRRPPSRPGSEGDAAPPVVSGPLLTNLWAFYDFETLTADRSTNVNNLTNTNAVAQAAGLVGQAASFAPASAQFLGSASAGFLLNTTDFTIACHVKPGTLVGGDTTVGRGILRYHTGEAAGNYHLAVRPNGTVAAAHWRNSGADTTGQHATTATGLVPTTGWTHICFRRLASTYTLWINGTSQAFTDGTTGAGWGVQNFRIGQAWTAGGYMWDGLIDQVGIWSRGLTNAEITWLWNSNLGRSWAEIQAYTG